MHHQNNSHDLSDKPKKLDKTIETVILNIYKKCMPKLTGLVCTIRFFRNTDSTKINRPGHSIRMY